MVASEPTQLAAVVVGGDSEVAGAVGRRLRDDGWQVVDAPSTADAAQAVADAVRELGRLDAVIVDAHVAPSGGLLETSAEDFDGAMSANVAAAFRWCQAGARAMVDEGNEGSLVLVMDSLSDGDDGDGSLSLVGDMSIGAIERFVRTTAVDMGGNGVRANAVQGQRKTPHRRLPPIPLGRPGTADEVAAVAAFLAGKRSRFITGAVVVVDGALGVAR